MAKSERVVLGRFLRYHYYLSLPYIILLIFISTSSHIPQVSSQQQAFYSLWTYPTPISDFGFSFSADTARVQLEDLLTSEDIDAWTFYIESLLVSQCEEKILEALDRGLNGHQYQIVYVLGAQFESCVRSIAANPKYSDLKFVLLSGTRTSPQISIGIPKMFQARFLQGMLCAQATKTGILGYVSSQPDFNPVVSRTTNAFALGAKFINPNITTLVGITNVFLEVVTTTKTTEILMDAGADCIAQQINDLSVAFTAASRGVYSIGYASDARYFAGETVLSSVLFDWLPIVETFARMILNDTWEENLYLWPGFGTDVVALSGYSTSVNPDWRIVIDEMTRYFHNGSAPFSYPFCSPLFDDPKWMTIENTEEINPQMRCLKPEVLKSMLGIISDAVVYVEFNSTNSPYQTVYIKWDSPGAILLSCFVGFLSVLVVISTLDVTINRNSPVYRSSSPLFCFLILLGIALGLVCPMLWIGVRTKYNCMLPWWFIGIAHALIYSCLLAKNWRIWKIFSSGHFKVMAIMNTDLLVRWVAVILALEIIILSLWTALDPQIPKLSGSTELKRDQLQLTCASKSGKGYGLGFFLAYNVSLLIPAALISYWTRIAKEEYRESHSIALIIYSSIILILIIIGISVALPNNYLISFFMGAYGIYCLLAVCYSVLFIPKLWKVHIRSSERTESSGMQLSTLGKSQQAFESVLYSRRSGPHQSTYASRADTDHVDPSRNASHSRA